MLVLALIISTTIVYALANGTKAPDVYVVQGMLQSLGEYAGNMNGKYGIETVSAIKTFQHKSGLTVTGTVDNQTLESMLGAYGTLKLTHLVQPMSTPQVIAKPSPTPTVWSTGIPSSLPTSTPVATPRTTPVATPRTTPIATPRTIPEAVPNHLSESSLGADVSLSLDEKQMIDLINLERINEGLAPLSADGPLTKVARLKSEDLIAQSYFDHQSPRYGSPFEMMKRYGIMYQTAGENLACHQTTKQAHTALMNSPGHRANILHESYTHMGIGVIEGGPCGKMYTQLFIGN